MEITGMPYSYQAEASSIIHSTVIDQRKNKAEYNWIGPNRRKHEQIREAISTHMVVFIQCSSIIYILTVLWLKDIENSLLLLKLCAPEVPHESTKIRHLNPDLEKKTFALVLPTSN